MLRWIVLATLLGLALITITVSYLNQQIAKEKLREYNIRKAVIKNIVKDKGVAHITLDGLDEEYNEQEVVIIADNYDIDEIYDGVIINT